jgi:hypothetical protein
MCGAKDKPCCTCFCGNGGCLASMREDFYMPATEEQVRKRLEDGSYPEYRDDMGEYLRALEIASKQTLPSLEDISQMNQILKERLYCCEDN